MDAEAVADLKKAINNFLWMHLPGSVTLHEAEAIALRWFEEIEKLYSSRNKEDS